jgi:hypothetical protein
MPFYPQLYARLRELLEAGGGSIAADSGCVERAWQQRFRQPLVWQHYGADGPAVRARRACRLPLPRRARRPRSCSCAAVAARRLETPLTPIAAPRQDMLLMCRQQPQARAWELLPPRQQAANLFGRAQQEVARSDYAGAEQLLRLVCQAMGVERWEQLELGAPSELPAVKSLLALEARVQELVHTFASARWAPPLLPPPLRPAACPGARARTGARCGRRCPAGGALHCRQPPLLPTTPPSSPSAPPRPAAAGTS